MKVTIAGSLFAVFALFVIFSDELFLSIVSILGTGLESGMKAREAIVIAGIAYLLMVADILKGRLSRRNYFQLFVLLIMLVMYYITGRFNPRTEIYDKYWSSFLSYGALCIPSCYIGMRLARHQYDTPILKLLPYYLIIVSAVVGSAIWYKSLTGHLLGQEDDVFSYQNSSYYMAFCFSYCFYYVFFIYEKKRTTYQKIIVLILFILLFICALGTIMGGGRGAFVYLVLITVYLIYRLMKKGRGGGRIKYFIFIAFAAIILFFLAMRLNILESTGAGRLIERLNVEGNDNRMQLWNKAFKVFLDSPIFGHGLGSIWWTVGYYSHNILADLLAETGLIGAVIIIAVLIRIFLRQSKRSYHSSFDLFLLLIFIGALVHDSFSGYWITSPKLFLLFGYVYGQVARKKHGSHARFLVPLPKVFTKSIHPQNQS